MGSLDLGSEDDLQSPGLGRGRGLVRKAKVRYSFGSSENLSELPSSRGGRNLRGKRTAHGSSRDQLRAHLATTTHAEYVSKYQCPFIQGFNVVLDGSSGMHLTGAPLRTANVLVKGLGRRWQSTYLSAPVELTSRPKIAIFRLGTRTRIRIPPVRLLCCHPPITPSPSLFTLSRLDGLVGHGGVLQEATPDPAFQTITSQYRFFGWTGFSRADE